MSDREKKPITQLLAEAGRGDEDARQRLWTAIYDELHRIARSQARAESLEKALQPTALVNEAYLRLVGHNHATWTDRRHFFAVAAKIMRRIRIDDARKRKRLKRGGGRPAASLNAAKDDQPDLARFVHAPEDDPSETLALDDALSRLEKIDPRKAELVMLRFYAGLTREQIGEMLGISPRTVDKEWSFARAWLHKELSGEQLKQGNEGTREQANGKRRGNDRLARSFLNPESRTLNSLMDRWQRIQDVFSRLLEIPPESRTAVLDQLSHGDREFRAEVESLLQHHESSGNGFLRPPAPPPDLPPSSKNPPKAADVRSDPLIDQYIGGYQLQRIIAAGGMGTVYLAEQDQPRRQVALKLLRAGMMSTSALRRFEYEAEILARLRHPRIAAVFEAGTHLGLPFFAMEYIPDALPITDYAARHGLSTRERLELFTQVCDAIQHGHQRGVIHRDLKPGNILVDPAGGVKVIDFGVARATDADVTLATMHTETGQIVGTLQYMSPEQCAADPHEIDTRSDVYSLGVTLYELLCRRLPYDVSTATLATAARIINEHPPTRPSGISGKKKKGGAGVSPARPGSMGLRPVSDDADIPSIRGDLEHILLTALEKDRASRYQSAADLERDIHHYLAGEPIEAKPPGAIRRIVQWGIRHPVFVTLLSCGLLLGVTVLASAVAMWYTSMRPDHVVITVERDAVQIQTALGVILNTLPGGSKDSIAYAKFLPPPAAPSGGPLVIVGYQPSVRGDARSGFAFYDLDRDRHRAYLELRIHDDDVPQVLLDRQAQPGGRRFRGEQFRARSILPADVFPDAVGGAADELIAVFQHEAVTHTAICVYRLDGTLLYRVWVDADISALYWLATPGYLALSGRNGEVPLRDRLVDDPPPLEAMHPTVVFAIKPEQGRITRDYVVQEPSLRDAAPAWLRPVWYKCLHPISQIGFLADSPKLDQPDLGHDPRETVRFRICIRPKDGPISYPATTTLPGRAWIIDGATGDVSDYPIDDVYAFYERTPERPDNPLPPYDSWRLGELPARRPDVP